MADSVTELIAVLADKEQLMGEMLQLLEKEQRSIVKLDFPALARQEHAKQQLMVIMETSNNSCRQLLKKVAAEYELPATATLSLVLEKIALPQRELLKGMQSRLFELSTSLDKMLALDRELLRGSLHMINRSLDFFKGINPDTAVYGGEGRLVQAGGAGRLLCKEI